MSGSQQPLVGTATSGVEAEGEDQGSERPAQSSVWQRRQSTRCHCCIKAELELGKE